MNTNLTSLASSLGMLLKKNHLMLVTAESCTGGGIGYWLTSIAGSSDWYERGFITYSNAAKMECLSVKQETLAQFGAVSAEVAREMAEGALKNSHADLSVAVTGIAGPDGGSKEKPVGTVWIAYAGKHIPTQAEVEIFAGDRDAVRNAVIANVLLTLQKFA